MTIVKKLDNNVLTIALQGRLDSTTAVDLEKTIEQSNGFASLVFDFTGLEYISSAGLRVLLTSQKQMNKQGGSMEIIGANTQVKDVFEITGFSEILTIK